MNKQLKTNFSQIAHIAIAVNDLNDISKWENLLEVKNKSKYLSDEQKI